MLVIARRCYETITVGDDIEITVVHIGRDNVRLGITAPLGVSVHQEEPREAIQGENRAGAVVLPENVIQRHDRRLTSPGRRVPQHPMRAFWRSKPAGETSFGIEPGFWN